MGIGREEGKSAAGRSCAARDTVESGGFLQRWIVVGFVLKNSRRIFLPKPDFTHLLMVFASSNGNLEILSLRGQHRPQRCRQTDRKAGEAMANVQAACLRGVWPKAIAVVVVRLF
jgi:hypothetical protein